MCCLSQPTGLWHVPDGRTSPAAHSFIHSILNSFMLSPPSRACAYNSSRHHGLGRAARTDRWSHVLWMLLLPAGVAMYAYACIVSTYVTVATGDSSSSSDMRTTCRRDGAEAKGMGP